MTPLIGFAPDIDPMVPGVMTDCSAVVPFTGGFKGAPSGVSVGADALAAACIGTAVTTSLSGTRRFFAGTTTRLYELGTTTWTDVTRSTVYAAAADDRWDFESFGSTALAATPSAPIQRSTSGAFANISGAPQAAFIEQSLGFVLAFNTIDGTYGTNQDGWWCSAYLDETDWTPALATQSARGRLVGGAGPITAARRFGDDVVAYKDRTVFVGRYAGPPSVWDWRQVSSDIGCVGAEAIVDTMIGHVFLGRDNIYVYDGTTPRPLEGTELIRDWLFSQIASAYRYKAVMLYDRINFLVYLFYPSGSSTVNNSALVYHLQRKQWGRADATIEAAVNYASPAFTYASGSPLVTTFDTGPSISFDSPFWNASTMLPAYFDSSHVLRTLSGITTASNFTTGDIGDEEGYSFCSGVKVRYTSNPTTSTATGYYKDEEGNTLTSGPSISKADGRHDLRQSGRFHRFNIAQTGDWEATGIRPQLQPDGVR
jgi:hypothetical protein